MKKHINNFKKLINLMDKPLLIIMIVFFIFGLLCIVSASSREAVVRYEVSTFYFLFKQLKMLLIGLVLSFVLINLKTKLYKKLMPIAYVIVLGLVFSLFIFGVQINGSVNWLPLPGIGTIQPSELAKPVMIIYIAVLFEQFNRLLSSDNKLKYNKIALILFVGLLIPVMTFLQKDLGSIIIMLVTFAILFLVSPITKSDKIRTCVLVGGVGIVGLALIFLVKGYLLTPAQLSRFNFYNPCSRYEDSGYQVCNGFIALNNGGLFGLGIGKSKQKYSYIPESHTDSIFAIIGEEYGVLKCSLIFVAYAFVLFRILKISTNASTIRGRYICLGVACYIFLHIFINLGGLFGIIPLTGVPLPFLSYGGSYAISLMCALAVVQRICIETKTEKIKIKKIH